MIKQTRPFYIFLLILITINTQACMRFTPSRASLVSEEGSRARLKEDDPKTKYLGREAFFDLENKQDERLKELTRERSKSIKTNQSASYKIGIGDVLELFVFETEELDRKVRVRPDGYISLPLLGTIKAIGRTEDELQIEITRKLDKFMHSPQVQLFIDEYAAHKVWVVGEIQKPGAYPLSRDNYSLIELISEAGGRKENASGSVVLIPDTIIRYNEREKENSEIEMVSLSEEKPIAKKKVENTETEEESTENKNNSEKTTNPSSNKVKEIKNTAALAEISSNLDLNQVITRKNGIEISFDSLVGTVDEPPVTVPLRAGDTIVVPEAGEIQIEGEVKSPGSIPLSSRMTLSSAIAAAGGFSFPADASIVEVVRELNSGGKAMIVLDVNKINAQEEKDVRLRDGDLIRVPSSRFRFAVSQVTSILNSVFGRLFAPLQTAP